MPRARSRLTARIVPRPRPTYPDPLFDGRASRLTSLWGYTRYLSNGPLQGGNTPNIYNSFAFWDGDITLQSDARFGQVFRIKIDQDSRNPNWSGQPATNPSCELIIKDRTLLPNQIDWYAVSYKVLPTWRVGSWGVNFQFGYPTLTSPPIAFAIDSRGVGIDRHAGTLTSVGQQPAPTEDYPRFHTLAQIYDQWLDIVLGVKWSVSGTGWVDVQTRIGGPPNPWVHQYGVSNTDTYQILSGSAWDTTVQDKMGAYLNSASFPSTWQNLCLCSGHVRCLSEAQALSILEV